MFVVVLIGQEAVIFALFFEKTMRTRKQRRKRKQNRQFRMECRKNHGVSLLADVARMEIIQERSIAAMEMKIATLVSETKNIFSSATSQNNYASARIDHDQYTRQFGKLPLDFAAKYIEPTPMESIISILSNALKT